MKQAYFSKTNLVPDQQVSVCFEFTQAFLTEMYGETEIKQYVSGKYDPSMVENAEVIVCTSTLFRDKTEEGLGTYAYFGKGTFGEINNDKKKFYVHVNEKDNLVQFYNVDFVEEFNKKDWKNRFGKAILGNVVKSYPFSVDDSKQD